MPDTTISEPCSGEQGHHFCITHEVGFPNNWSANGHHEAHTDCVFVWVCPEHGFERAP